MAIKGCTWLPTTLTLLWLLQGSQSVERKDSLHSNISLYFWHKAGQHRGIMLLILQSEQGFTTPAFTFQSRFCCLQSYSSVPATHCVVSAPFWVNPGCWLAGELVQNHLKPAQATVRITDMTFFSFLIVNMNISFICRISCFTLSPHDWLEAYNYITQKYDLDGNIDA